jgi:hypothetical protein
MACHHITTHLTSDATPRADIGSHQKSRITIKVRACIGIATLALAAAATASAATTVGGQIARKTRTNPPTRLRACRRTAPRTSGQAAMVRHGTRKARAAARGILNANGKNATPTAMRGPVITFW